MNHQIINTTEQVQWTRFDSQDPSTFPPVGQFLYISEYGGSIDYRVGYHAEDESDDEFGFYYFEEYMTHWAPLPPPPQAK